jgi:hypothetical protein
MGTVVSDEPVVSTFTEEETRSSTLKMEAVRSSETMETIY